MYIVDLLPAKPRTGTEGSRVTLREAGQPEQRTLDVTTTVNGRRLPARVEPRALLVHVIRDNWKLTGTKIGCDTSQCGACTVLLDGRAVKSCTVLAAQADGALLTTIEGLEEPGALTILQQQFRDRHALQCGFCTPGMIMAATGLIIDGLATDEDAVRRGLAGNICRCTGYGPIVQAVLAAADARADCAEAAGLNPSAADAATPGAAGGAL
jgi:aerobic carbon-monoxide dehydrogenase small subunit